MALNSYEKDLITYIEQYWFTNNAYPSDSTLKRYATRVSLSFERIKEIEKKLEPYLGARGVINRTDSRLTDQQLAAVNLMVNFMDKRPLHKKLKALGISATKWQGWQRDKTFSKYLKFMTEEMLNINMTAVNDGLLNAAEAGNVRAAQFVYEITGRYKKDSPVANIQLLIVQIIEVIQKHVHDPETLRGISSDFEELMFRTQLQNRNEIEGEIESIENKPKPSMLSPVLTSKVFDPDDLFSEGD